MTDEEIDRYPVKLWSGLSISFVALLLCATLVRADSVHAFWIWLACAFVLVLTGHLPVIGKGLVQSKLIDIGVYCCIGAIPGAFVGGILKYVTN